MQDDIAAAVVVAKLERGHSLSYKGVRAPCLVGKSGIVDGREKREADGATPAGTWPLREVLYRPDRLTPSCPALPARAIGEEDGWCDDPAKAEYNRPVTLPFAGSHERLWREDHAYDVVVPLGYNDDPPVAGMGSAIFLHCIEEGRTFTEGCVAIAPGPMMDLLPLLEPDTVITITG